jgi:tetratricopeptide (TPR) repeat protein
MRKWTENTAYVQGVALYEEHGDPHGAVALLRKAIEVQPDRARIHSHLGCALLRAGMHDEARAAAMRGVALSEADDPVPASGLSDVLRQLGDYEGALTAADDAIARAGERDDRRDALVAKGWALLGLGRGRLAIGVAEDAIAGDPQHAGAHIVLAHALAIADRWGEAKRILERAAALAPGDEEVARTMATVQEGLEAVRRALALARTAVKEQPESFDAWVTLGVAQVMAGQLSNAADTFDRAHALNPDPDDRWPAEPHMLSPFEADCRIALIEASRGRSADETATKRRVRRKKASA